MFDDQPILSVHHLNVAYRQKDAWQIAVRDVSLRITPGQSYGLVGESGSGKTTLAMAIMGYLGENARILKGQIRIDNNNLLELSPSERSRLWGREISLVPQDPLSSLNPSLRVGEQIIETLCYNQKMDRPAANTRLNQLLQMVKFPDPERVARSYPHQLSGGMQQRVMIAIALSTSPRLLILDEPTTNLDVTTQASILDLLRDLIREFRTAVLYVTHNLGIVARICDRVAVMYAGDIVEDSSIEDLFQGPLHPYTKGLLGCIPILGQNKKQARLRPIPGRIPPLGARPDGCAFVTRCPLAVEICQERPPLQQVNSSRSVSCHRWKEIDHKLINAWPVEQIDIPHPLETVHPSEKPFSGNIVLETSNLSVSYALPRSLRQILLGKPGEKIQAVNGINLSIPAGQTLGLVGETGSGKTTFARAIAGLVERTDGNIELLSYPLHPNLSKRDLIVLRQLQMVFQNPEETLNPYLNIGVALERPLITLKGLSRLEAQNEIPRLLAAVHLPESYSQRMPGQLSGGEKQRIAIARALASLPELLLADEPVSSLDVSVQASILNLMSDLQVERGGSMLFISHDLSVIGYLADTIAVIYSGQIMEITLAEELFKPPHHPYTEVLLSAIPLPAPVISNEHLPLRDSLPSESIGISGCPFHPRCPRFLGDICINNTPPWQKVNKDNWIFCNIPVERLRDAQAEPAHPA